MAENPVYKKCIPRGLLVDIALIAIFIFSNGIQKNECEKGVSSSPFLSFSRCYSLGMKTYTGSCHCGAVHYEVDIENLKEVIDCNCSICSKRGSLFTFVPATQFRLNKGKENLTEYQFNKHVIHHLFCKTCGILSFAEGKGPDGTEMVGVNVRCLDDIDISSLTLNHYDGKSL